MMNYCLLHWGRRHGSRLGWAINWISISITILAWQITKVKQLLCHMPWCLGKYVLVSVSTRQCSRYVSIQVSVCVSTGCGCVASHHSFDGPWPSAAATRGFCFCWLPESNAAVQPRADCAGQEVGCRDEIKHLLIFVFRADDISVYYTSKNT